MGYLFNEHVHHDFSPFKTCVAEGVAMILAVFLILCLFGGPLLAANDFSGDESCMALWRFENGALTTDSSGNSNTLTSRYNPVADTSNYMEGAASVDLEYGDHDNYDIADASLSAGFPFKSGGTDNDITVCWWMKPETVPGSGPTRPVFSKYQTADNGRSFTAGMGYDSNPRVLVQTGYNSGSTANTAIWHASTISAGEWYHVAVTYADATKTAQIRVRDASGDAVGSDVSSAFDNAVSLVSTPVCIGRLYNDDTTNWDGLLDEVVVFNRVLSASETNAICAGTFGAADGNDIIPANLSPNGGTLHSRSQTLSWTAASGCTAYDVYLGTDADLGAGDLVSDNQAGTSYLATGLVRGTTYYWRVVGSDGAGPPAEASFTIRDYTVLVTP